MKLRKLLLRSDILSCVPLQRIIIVIMMPSKGCGEAADEIFLYDKRSMRIDVSATTYSTVAAIMALSLFSPRPACVKQ